MEGLYNAINHIALFYHWTEDQILRLPLTRINKYIELIDEYRKNNSR